VKILLLALQFILPPPLKPWLLRTFAGARVGRHVQIGWFAALSGRSIVLGDRAAIRPCTLIVLGGAIAIGRQSEVSSMTLIYGSSNLSIGDHSYIGPQSLLNVDAPVAIGSMSALGPRTMLFTHGSWFPATKGYWTRLAGVTLGDRVWCAAGVFLHPGVTIGDDCFVNARSVVTQEIDSGSVAEGHPAQVVYPMERIRRRMTPTAVERTVESIVANFVQMVVEGEWGCAVVRGDREWSFAYRGRNYTIVVVGATSCALAPSPGRRTIAAVATAGWTPPAGVLALDFTEGRTSFDLDDVHTALRVFALRYYGERFDEVLS
jgi:acetyltransferase-like isoleucine patch superfamily enzyme